MNMKKIALRLIVPFAALALGACGSGEVGEDTRTASGTSSVAESRRILTEIDAAASDYGRDHLGHFLKMREADLIAGGVSVPEGIRLALDVGHTDYCATVENIALPTDHPWRVASVGSASSPSAADRCG